MRKAVTLFLVLAILCGGFYYCLQMGYIDRWFPGVMEKVIPGYKSTAAKDEGRVSSTDANAVFVDSIKVIADLGSGTGQIPRFAGTVEPQETREYKLEGERKVKKCYVKEGDIVKSGQKLFTYDTTEDESKLEQSRIDLERLQNTEDTSEAKKAELEKQKAAADTPEKKLQVLTAENELKQNELDQKSKAKEIEQLEDQIKNATVTCDMEGVVKSVNDQSESDMMGGSDSAYISILKLGTYRVKAEANEQNIKQIYKGESVLVFSRVDSSQFWRGSISEIKTDQGSKSENNEDSYYGSDNSAGSTNYPFYVELDDSEGLMLGQHVYLEEDRGQENAKTGLWLESYYIAQESDGTHYVWAASSKNQLEKRVVELGEKDEDLDQYKILSGLTSDDYICQPQKNLEEGLPVHYNDDSGEGETESMYTWGDGMPTETESMFEEDYLLDDEGMTESGDWYFDETEDYGDYYVDDEFSDDSYDGEAFDDEFGGGFDEGLDAGVRYDGMYETDNEGFVIMR